MKTRTLWLLASFFSLALLRAAGADLPGETVSLLSAAATPQAAEITLLKGMTSEQVLKLAGKPSAIEVIEHPDVKAESWTYRHLVEQHSDQDAAKASTEPAYIGPGMGDGHGMGTRTVAEYITRHTSTYQVTVLLMVNDHFVVSKQWKDQVVSYSH